MNTISFEPFPELLSDKYKLRQLINEDAEKIFEIRANKEIEKFIDRPLAKTIDDALAFIKKITKAISRNEAIYWGIFQKENSEMVGTITLWQISSDGLEAEIGFELLPKFQGLGVMQEVLVEIIKYAFDEMKLSVIKGEVDPRNIKSIRLMNSFGFVQGKSLEKTEIYYLKKTI